MNDPKEAQAEYWSSAAGLKWIEHENALDTAMVDMLALVLGAAEIDPRPDFPALLRLILSHRDDLASCLCVMVGWDAARASFVRDLLRNDVSPLVLAVFPTEPLANTAARQYPPAVPFLPLVAGQIQSGLHQLPRLLAGGRPK